MKKLLGVKMDPLYEPACERGTYLGPFEIDGHKLDRLTALSKLKGDSTCLNW